ncbi:PEP/pyruvate-binding domain-containing protein [Desulfoluna butyratoxydans]|uniref:Phosphoenolpyruvate synthase n=1 Tax=Desulfoluna butyratoxydans TaxID=231438 RepID=A0A4U8YVQ9_9BACT|nr:PEP/pyruvate-binding domain-containing protein [Desulfoluna butyratoxydans]VFQ45493.1 pyruvate phosphate dikinase pep/pyruvate-binding [Desulfoluna butyratoxydans]
MTFLVPLARAGTHGESVVGGKASALARMVQNGILVPDGLCVTAEAYGVFVSEAGLFERIQMTLQCKPFSEMRWEEVWDAALRIRNLFLTAPWPPALYEALATGLERFVDGGPLVVRSSCPEEDSRGASFAGLHDSYVNVRGLESTLDHIKRVWASLWSDGALLYRREREADFRSGTMAVLVQRLVSGEVSGVAFSQSPLVASEGVVEAVYGLNQGLVDGTVEPDHWRLDRASGAILSHRPPEGRPSCLGVGPSGVRTVLLPEARAARPPLGPEEVASVFALARRMESLLDSPQDLEWTLAKGRVHVLQSRPITTLEAPGASGNDALHKRLHRSYDNLCALRQKIETRLLPEMADATEEMARVCLETLDDGALVRELRHRLEINETWVGVYWSEFIPFAHGVRLFGQAYNDAVKPDDPFEFTLLLTHTPLVGMARNRRLGALAAQMREHPDWNGGAGFSVASLPPEIEAAVSAFIEDYGELSWAVAGGALAQSPRQTLVSLILEMAAHPPAPEATARDASTLEERFLGSFPIESREYAQGVLALGRSSYRLRDDDNIYMGRLEAELFRAVAEGRRRLEQKGTGADAEGLRGELERFGSRPTIQSAPARDAEKASVVTARQIMGQPAGQGLARGRARVIRSPGDLAGLAYGEILVCDVVEPTMTHVVPLAAGIVERRGGMLIHGAIIAREYGLPCVTGVPDATVRIATGDLLTVDGYLGIVTLGETDEIFGEGTAGCVKKDC